MHKKYCISLILILFFGGVAYADHREEKHKDRDHSERHGNNIEDFSSIPHNEMYDTECGACHLSYPPQLLPLESWQKILSILPSHFDSDVQIDDNALKSISKHLNSYSKRSFSKDRSLKKERDLADKRSLRITETTFFKKEHHELDAETFSRPSIGSPANCIACHVSADKGIFDEHQIRVPRE